MEQVLNKQKTLKILVRQGGEKMLMMMIVMGRQFKEQDW